MARTKSPSQQNEAAEPPKLVRRNKPAEPTVAQQPVRMVRKNIPDEIKMKTRCHWPCPCGGTVPDAPDYCEFSWFVPRANTWCVDASTCNFHCGEKLECEAFKRFKQLMKERRVADEMERDRNNAEQK